MPNRIVNILDDEIKNLLKIVILGFITLDFFSPLTFKFIAMLFGEPEQMAVTFKVFRTTYLLLPLGLMFVFLIWNKRINMVKDLLSNISYGKRTGILLAIALLVAMISTIVCLFFVDSVTPFNVVKYLSIGSGILIVATGLSLIAVHSKPKIVWDYQIAIGITFGILITFYLLLSQYIDKSKYLGTTSIDILVSKKYLSPFSEQSALISKERKMDKLDSVKREISMKISAIQIRLGLFQRGNQRYLGVADTVKTHDLPIVDDMDKFLKKWDGQTGDTVKNFLEGINTKVNDINASLGKVDSRGMSSKEHLSLTKELEIISSGLPYIWLQLLSAVSNQQKGAMKEAVDLLHYEQIIELIILFTSLTLLLFCWLLLSRVRAVEKLGNLLFLKGTIYLYVLMAFQMMKPVNPNHINIQDVGWPFTYANWYLPDYIQSIGTLNQDIDNSVVNFGDNIENGIDKQEIILLQQKITELQLTINGISQTAKEIKNDTDKINK